MPFTKRKLQRRCERIRLMIYWTGVRSFYIVRTYCMLRAYECFLQCYRNNFCEHDCSSFSSGWQVIYLWSVTIHSPSGLRSLNSQHGIRSKIPRRRTNEQLEFWFWEPALLFFCLPRAWYTCLTSSSSTFLMKHETWRASKAPCSCSLCMHLMTAAVLLRLYETVTQRLNWLYWHGVILQSYSTLLRRKSYLHLLLTYSSYSILGDAARLWDRILLAKEKIGPKEAIQSTPPWIWRNILRKLIRLPVPCPKSVHEICWERCSESERETSCLF